MCADRMENSLPTMYSPTKYKFENIHNSLDLELKQIDGLPSTKQGNSNFVLHELIKHGNAEELYKHVASLLSSGYQAVDKVASALDFEGFAALHYAALQPSVVAARLLLDQGVNLDVESKSKETPLHISLRHGNIPIASLFMDRGANLKKVDSHGNNALLLAIERGLRGVAVKILMRSPFLVYSQNKTGFTALHYAAIQGDAQLCEKLISCEAKVTAKNMNGETPLHLASLLNHVDVIKVLLEKGCYDNESRSKYLNFQRNDNFTALHIASQMGHIETVKFILDNVGVKVNPCVPISHPLELAASDGHLDIMELFLANGAIVDAKDRYGNTALHRAAMNGQLEAIKLLICHGANLEAVNEDGWSPLFFAVTRSKTDATAMLLENGADSNRVDSKLCCPLHYAVKEDCSKIIMLLLQSGGEGLIFRRNINDRLILHEAVISGNEKILGILLNRCSGTIIYCEDNKTLIHLAAEHGQLLCLQKLIDIWPREYLDMQDNNGQTALHLAAMNGYNFICVLLIESKAELNTLNKVGKKPIHFAIINKHDDVVKTMIEAKADLVPEDITVAIKAENVNAMVMLMDFMTTKYVGVTDLEFDGLLQALDGNCQDVVEAIVDHYSFKEAVKFNNISIKNVMPKMIMKYPEVAIKVLDKGITASDNPVDCPNLEVTYDFSSLEEAPSACSRMMGNDLYFGPALMAEFNREECLAHPLTQKLINLKWSNHGGYFYYLSFFVYLVFIVSLTTLVILEREADIKKIQSTPVNATLPPSHPHKPSATSSGKILAYFIFIFLCITAFKELIQMIALRSRYFTELTNILEWIVLISAFGYLYSFLFMEATSENTELLFGVCCMFFGWLNVLLFLRRSPLFNIYVVMFTQVILTLIRVLFVFTPLLLAFALAFNQLFIRQTVFKDIWNSYMKTFVMFMGEMEYGETLPNSLGKKDESALFHLVPLPSVSYILYAVFIIMIPVAMMNLLVGLAVGDIESIRESAKHNVMKQQARYIKDLRDKLPKFVITWTYKRLHTDRPNDVHWLRRLLFLDTTAKEELMAFLQGRMQDTEISHEKKIATKVDDVQASLDKQDCLMRRIWYTLDDHSRILRGLHSPDNQ